MKRTISKGFGALTPDTWNELVQAVDRTSGGSQPKNVGSGLGFMQPRMLIAKLGASTVKTAGIAAWEYAWTEVRRTNGTALTWGSAADGISNTTTDCAKAVNVLEGSNVANTAYGYAVNTSLFVLSAHDGFNFKPVPPNTIVHLLIVRATDGAVSFEFSAPNPIDGECVSALIGAQCLDFMEFDAESCSLDLATFATSNPQAFDLGNF